MRFYGAFQMRQQQPRVATRGDFYAKHKLDPDVAARFPTERAVNDALWRLAAQGVGV